MRFEDFGWDELPVHARDAAALLGHDESTWDASDDEEWEPSSPPVACSKPWASLTEGQREAAAVLGYDETTWDGERDDGMSCGSGPSAGASSPPAKDRRWSELTVSERRAALVLGYDRERWEEDDCGRPPETASRRWCDLSDGQRVAAEGLGYDESKWDGDCGESQSSAGGSSASSSSASVQDKHWDDLTPEQKDAARILGYDESKWEHDWIDNRPDCASMRWKDLNERMQRAAGELGYDESKWEHDFLDNRPDSATLAWDELTEEQRKAAGVLGYDSSKWDDASSSSSSSTSSSGSDADGGGCSNAAEEVQTEASEQIPSGITVVQPAVKDKYWSDLTADQRAAAGVLEYDESNWDDGSDAEDPPAVESMAWCELSEAQRDAARVLGYDEQMWDETSQSSCSESGLEQSDDEVEREIRSLEREIESRRRRLNALVSSQKGDGSNDESRYGRMLSRYEDRANSLLRSRVGASELDDGDGSQSRQQPRRQTLPPRIAALLESAQDSLLHEVHHTFPAFASFVVHCLVWISTYAFLSGIVYNIGEFTVKKIGGWNLTDRHYDASSQEAMFYTFAIVVSYFMARMTGSLYEWNDRRDYNRRVRFHARNRWVLGCWDSRLTDWFDGGETGRTHGLPGTGTEGEEGRARRLSRRLGPSAKTLIDAFGFVLAYYSINRLVELGMAGLSSNRRGEILDGLPSRVLARHMRDGASTSYASELVCGDILGTNEDGSVPPGTCLESFDETMFVTDAWNWVSNHNRCGWVAQLAELDDSSAEGGGVEETTAANALGDGMASTITGRALGEFKPWGDEGSAPDAWLRELNRKDDAYLRSVLSDDNYLDLMGDPTAVFHDDGWQDILMVVLAVGGLLYLRWAGISFVG